MCSFQNILKTQQQQNWICKWNYEILMRILYKNNNALQLKTSVAFYVSKLCSVKKKNRNVLCVVML